MTNKFVTVVFIFMLFSTQSAVSSRLCEETFSEQKVTVSRVVKFTKQVLSQKNISKESYERIVRSAVSVAANTGDKEAGIRILELLLEKENLPEGVPARAMEGMREIKSFEPGYRKGSGGVTV